MTNGECELQFARLTPTQPEIAHAGGAASNQYISQLEQINRETRAKLLVAVTDLELERKESKKVKKEEKKVRKQQSMRINVGGNAVGSGQSSKRGKKVRLSSPLL